MNPSHPLAELLPAMTEAEFSDLKESIERNGLRRPIVMIGNQVLTGRHRMKACQELGITPQIRQYDPQKDGPLPVEFVLDEEINRRHMGTDQRAVVAAKLHDWQQAEKKVDPHTKGEPRGPLGDQDPEPKPTPADLPVPTAGEKVADAAEGQPDNVVAMTANEEDGVKPNKHISEDEQALMDKLKVGRDKLRQAIRVQKADPDILESVAAGSLTLDEAEELINRRAGATKYRKEAADMLSAQHGDETGDLVRNCELLYPDKDLKAFMGIAVKAQGEILETIKGTKWSARQAIQFHSAAFGGSDTVHDLLDWAAWELARTGKKRATFTVSSHKITIEPSTKA